MLLARVKPRSDIAVPPATTASRGSLLRNWEWVIVALIASRLIIFAAILLSRLIFKPDRFWQSGDLISVLIQWDASLWYLDIAREGYTFSLQHPSRMPFFPLYPIVVKIVSFVFHDLRVAGLLVSNASLVAAALLFNALINVDYDDPRINRAAAMFFMFSPYSFFFSCAYTESMFLMLAMGSFLAARHQRWMLASVLGMLLSATRQVGLLIALPLFVEYVRQNWQPGQTLWQNIWNRAHVQVLWLAIVPLGLGAYMLFSYVQFGDPLAFANAAAHGFKRSFTSPMVTLSTVAIYPTFFDLLFIGAIVVSILIVVAGVFLRVRVSYLVFASVLTATYLCSSTLEALPRYLSVEFALFIALGVLCTRFKWAYEPLLVASVGLLTLCTILFATGFWIT